MKRLGILLAAAAAFSSILVARPTAQPRQVSFEERVRAQEAIERVYYSHQIGAHLSFEEAVPSTVLERKVRTYLRQSAALATIWNDPITSTMLRDELDRVARGTRFPERLEEIFTALDHDSFLIQECFVRPVLAERLAHEHFRREVGAGAASEESWDSWWRDEYRFPDESSVAAAAEEKVHLPSPGGFSPKEKTAPSIDAAPQLDTDCGAQQHWNATSTFAGPAAGNVPIVWTGNVAIVWGTQSGGNSGSRYDPVVDSWSVTSLTGAPAWRDSFSVVWTGNQMIVWGGGVAGPNFNTGGRYDPVADTWTPTSTAAAPQARYAHAAIWTGTRMVVFGGRWSNPNPFESPYLRTGGVYDPSTDSWTATSTVGAPSGQQEAAFWTGSLMLVWGAYPFQQGRYDPAADVWSPMATLGPGVRSGANGVWTGTRMVIWGGMDETSTRVTTGGRYDPVTDTWSPTSTAGAPIGREFFSAVWTGSQMIVWGGQVNISGALYTDTGGLYDPMADLWSPMTTVNAPSPRYVKNAVWTGNFMVVWGGLTTTGYTNTGGRFSLSPPDPIDFDGDGQSACAGDCNDHDPAIHAGAAESCNAIDDDCDGTVDEGFDQDADGYTACGGDCNDANPAVNPGVAEVCNLADENCNGSIDEGFDQDADGFTACGGDCNDGNPSVHPGAVETCDNLDSDCNGVIEDNFDLDGDGVTACNGDCNDANPAVWDYPVEEMDLTLDPGAPTNLSWFDLAPFIGPETQYDLVSGAMGPGAGINTAAGACLQSGLTQPQYADSRPNPSPGTGVWYLVRARNSCGAGTYGTSSAGLERVLPSCP